MKRLIKPLAICLALIVLPAHAAIDERCEPILNATEIAFSELFPPGPVTQVIDSLCFRAYTVGNITRYAAINASKTSFLDVGVYVLGPPFGDTPTYIGTTDQVQAILDNLTGGEGGNTGESICDNSNSEVSGIKTFQDGDTITITTEGKCVKLPKNNSLCDIKAEKQEDGTFKPTDIHMLTTTNLVSYSITGLDIPGFLNPLDPFAKSFANSTCLIHVPERTFNYKSHTDVCFDISELAQGIPGIPDIVTMQLIADSSSVIVDDCSKTGADTILNLVTGLTE